MYFKHKILAKYKIVIASKRDDYLKMVNDEKVVDFVLSNSTYLPESETLAQIFKLKTGGVQRANPWRDLPTIASYIDMDGLENDDRAEESILRAMRNQGW